MAATLSAFVLTGAAPPREAREVPVQRAGAREAARGSDGRTPAQRAPRDRPGRVLSAEPTTFRSGPGQPTDTAAWRIHYRSTGADGRPNRVSGTVIVPRAGGQRPRPLVTYAVGTVGMADKCAPSAGFPDGTTTEAPLVNAALARGYAVAVTDYEGLGTPGDHTYTVGRAEGTAVLDAARAAQRLPGARRLGVRAASPVGIMGYSQGGQAGAWAAELHASYAPELRVKGTASGGVPADLTEVFEAGDGGDNAGFLLMSAMGHDAAFPELRLGTYLDAEGRRLTGQARRSCLADILAATRGRTIESLTVRDPLRQRDWKRRIAADTLGTKAPSAPIFLYHGESDEVVPYAVGRGLRADWCARGNAVRWLSFPGSGHVATAAAGNGPALDWLGQRFAGEPARGNCPG